MSSRFRTSLLAGLALIVMGAAPSQGEFAICVEPDNLPFADRRGAGFEPAIAGVLAEVLGAELKIVPVARTGRGYVRSTLGRARCDAIMGVPVGSEGLMTTDPYYQSGWMFVTLSQRALHVRGFDDPVLSELRIGVPSVGQGYDTPPLAALARRGITSKLHLYGVTGLGGATPGPARMIDGLETGEIDIAIMWGPVAGYFSPGASKPIAIEPTPTRDREISLTTPIAIGVRRSNTELRDLLNKALVERRKEISSILEAYHVPLTGP
jgi:mxaJ protein